MMANMNKKIAILYGWAEGAGHAKHLRTSLRAHGFHITRKPEEADIIIAHSGGIFLLPSNMRAELVMLIGVPYWPGKRPIKSLLDKIRFELKNRSNSRYLIRKILFNCIYIASKPIHHYRIWISWKKKRYPSSSEASFLAVRNKHDVFTNHKDVLNLASDNNWNVVSLYGQHDDLWLNPENYIRLIKSKLTK